MVQVDVKDCHCQPRQDVTIQNLPMDWVATLPIIIFSRLLRLTLLTKLLFVLLFLQGGCLFYSFSGSSLSKEAKTFTIQEFQSKIALGPPNLAEQIVQRLREEITQKTSLKEANSSGDIQFDGMITKFDYTPIAPRTSSGETMGSRTQLRITVQLNYTNIHHKDFEFSKKEFTQTTDVEAGKEQTEEASMVEEVVKKLIQDIFNASIANW